MRVTLIHTDDDVWALGVRSVSAVLKEAGHSTRIVILPPAARGDPGELLDQVQEVASDSAVIGISCLSRSSDHAREVVTSLRSLGKPIVWGGLHATLNPEECLEVADCVCRGEGEGMLLDFVDRVSEGRSWTDIDNLGYRTNGAMVLNPLRPPIADLDSLPLVDFSCDDEYRVSSERLTRISYVGQGWSTDEIPFTGSRGCAFNCTYCCNAKLKDLYARNGRYVRKMSTGRYIDQCAALLEVFPRERYRYFHLADEDFLAHTVEELEEFSELFPKKIGMPFQCMASPAHVTSQKMDLLVKAGLWRIHMGVESGSERTKREVYQRHVSNDVVVHASEVVAGYRKVVCCQFLIIANPYEDRDDLLETIRLLLKLPTPYFLRIYNLVFFPGSILYERAVADGLIAGKDESGYELDFLAGLPYEAHAWKRTNLYLNGLIFLMHGRCGRYQLGLLPRVVVAALTRPRVIDFNDRHPVLIRSLIALKRRTVSFRRSAGVQMRRLVSLRAFRPQSVTTSRAHPAKR
jgi:anaerobic magnesium-protoporphyrin IX monomethyl ester cyclase